MHQSQSPRSSLQKFPASFSGLRYGSSSFQNYLYFLEISAHTSVSKLSEVMGLVAGDHAKFLLHFDLLFSPSVCPTASCALAEGVQWTQRTCSLKRRGKPWPYAQLTSSLPMSRRGATE